MNELASEIRIALLRAFAGPFEVEDSAFAEAGLSGPDVSVAGPFSVRRVTAGPESIVVTQRATNDQLASVSIAGPGRLDLALRLAARLPFVPEAALHRAARSAPTAGERRDALRLLGELHQPPAGTPLTDGRMRRTLDRAWHDPDPSVRIDAAAVEIECNPGRARPIIEAAAAAEFDDIVREALNTLRRHTQPPTARPPADEPDTHSDSDDGPLVLPILWTGSLDQLSARFPNAPLAAEHTVRWQGVGIATVIEMHPVGFDAAITVASAGGGVAGVAFTGPDQTATAIGSAAAMRYLPVELAIPAVWHASDAATRITALRALTVASSRRLFPGPAIAPDVVTAIQHATEDADAAVREAAATAVVLLRDEIASGATGGQEENRDE